MRDEGWSFSLHDLSARLHIEVEVIETWPYSKVHRWIAYFERKHEIEKKHMDDARRKAERENAANRRRTRR